MLIKSSFKDYYDTTSGMGVDPSVIYVREPNKVQAETNFYAKDLPFLERYDDASIAAWNSRELKQFHIIGFCGQHIVCVTNSKHENDVQYSKAYFGDDILALAWSKEKRHRQISERQAIEDCVRQFHGKKDDSLFKQFNAPVFHIDIDGPLTKYEQKNAGLYTPQYNVNICLKMFQFVKFKDAYTAFQDIQSYISGVLGSAENPIVEVSNATKIVKAGFDLKTSFRKDKK